MGKRGPPKKPRALKKIAGTIQPCRDNPDEPVFDGVANCPTWLSAMAKRKWKKHAKALESRGLLTEEDEGAYAAYCQSWARWYEAEKAVKKVTLETAIMKGYVNATDKALNQMNRWGAKFGLSPADRTGVVAKEPSGKKNKSRHFA